MVGCSGHSACLAPACCHCGNTAHRPTTHLQPAYCVLHAQNTKPFLRETRDCNRSHDKTENQVEGNLACCSVFCAGFTIGAGGAAGSQSVSLPVVLQVALV